MSEEIREPMPNGPDPDDRFGGDAPSEEPRVEEPPTPAEPPIEEPPTPPAPPVEEPPSGEPSVEEPPAGDSSAEASTAPGELTGELAAIEESLSDDEGDLPVEGPDTSLSSDEYDADAQVPAEDALSQTAVLEPLDPQQTDEELASEVDMGPERRSNAWVWVGLAAGVLIAAAAVGYAWWYTTARPIAVPSVIGKLPAPAVQAINDAGLRLGKVTEIPTETAPPGTVVEQSPVAFTQLKPNGTVAIVLAASPKGAKVPNVMGQTADAAAATLAEQRLVAFRVESFAATAAAETVVSQLPTAGAELQPGTLVAIAVSKGPAPTQLRVPTITGLKEADAEALLDASDLRYVGYRSFNASVSAGVVMTQSPSPESFIPYDGVVQYAVSEGAGVTAVTVPNVVSDKRSAAVQELKQRGLKPTVREVSNPSVLEGRVIAQMPLANSRTAKGAKVGLLVSKGAATSAPVPSLNGLTSEEASKTVRSAGFTPVFVEVATAEHPGGQVFGQFPDAATAWMLRLPVIAVVARQ
ncbi:MAG TPA: PASTA domain-containing protein [Coriobacteriia bacterium]|nr:PASTA domain-containing protein [Coriobacteriia bacterium]